MTKIKTTRLMVVVTAFLLFLTLAACGNNNAAPSPPPEQWGNDPTPSPPPEQWGNDPTPSLPPEQWGNDPSPSDINDTPAHDINDLADAIAKLPQSDAVDIVWNLLDGYWNASDKLFVVFARQDDLPSFTYGLWESSGLGFGEFVGAEATGEYEAALTIRFPATEANEIFDAREEWFATIYIDMSGFESDGKFKIKSENHGSGDWYTYVYGGETGEEAYMSFQNNILGTWSYSHSTKDDNDMPFIIHELVLIPPSLEITEEFKVTTAFNNEIEMTGNIMALFYESYFVGTWRKIGTNTYEIFNMEAIGEGGHYDHPDRIDLLQYDTENGLLRYTFFSVDIHHYFTRD